MLFHYSLHSSDFLMKVYCFALFLGISSSSSLFFCFSIFCRFFFSFFFCFFSSAFRSLSIRYIWQIAFTCPSLWQWKQRMYGQWFLRCPALLQFQHLFLLFLLVLLWCRQRSSFPFISTSSLVTSSSRSIWPFCSVWSSWWASCRLLAIILCIFCFLLACLCSLASIFSVSAGSTLPALSSIFYIFDLIYI